MALVWLLVALGSPAIGCAIFSERGVSDAESEAYTVALHRMVRSHVYDMRCEALLPLAREVLWEADFEQVDYQGDHDGLRTEWVERDDMLRARYEVHPHRVGANRCAVQFLYREQAGARDRERRAMGREIELLEYVDAPQADRIRARARQEAQEAVSDQQ